MQGSLRCWIMSLLPHCHMPDSQSLCSWLQRLPTPPLEGAVRIWQHPVILMGFSLYVIHVFSPSYSFQYFFSLYSMFNVLTMLCHRVFLFWSYLVGVYILLISVWMCHFFSLGKFSSMFLLEVWCMSMTYNFSLWSIPIIQDLLLRWCPTFPAYSFPLLHKFSRSFYIFCRLFTLSSSIFCLLLDSFFL